MDVFLYNGEIKRSSDLAFIEKVNAEKKSEECLVVWLPQEVTPMLLIRWPDIFSTDTSRTRY